MAEPPDVRPGQVWADNDSRNAGRTLRVDWCDDGSAGCTVITNYDTVQRYIDAGTARAHGMSDRRGKSVRIRLARFRPTSTGYRLVKDVDGEVTPRATS